jgi:hypothetical protein
VSYLEIQARTELTRAEVEALPRGTKIWLHYESGPGAKAYWFETEISETQWADRDSGLCVKKNMGEVSIAWNCIKAVKLVEDN